MGKQFPYVVLGMLTFVIMLLMAFFIFHVPVKGSSWPSCWERSFIVFSTCGFGQLVSVLARTQVGQFSHPQLSP